MNKNIAIALHDGTTIEVGLAGESGNVVMLPGTKPAATGREAEMLKLWGVDPELGRRFVDRLSDTFRVLSFDYEGHRFAHPLPDALTPETIATDLLLIADGAGVDRFGYYGYSWLALAGLQLALRTDRVAALMMGGFPPYGGPYREMLTVTEKTYEQALLQQTAVNAPAATELAPDQLDWEQVQVTIAPGQTKQFHTLYAQLAAFDDTAIQHRLRMPRLAFAGERDTIVYGANFGGVTVDIAGALRHHQEELRRLGWDVEILAGDGMDHTKAMQPETALPLVKRWLGERFWR
ncbi:MAG: alpha/beta hydrolase [Paenibacillaceae bacterium]|nr:alpha/beta hydrolase [Paenibacillaceae bacterium]